MTREPGTSPRAELLILSGALRSERVPREQVREQLLARALALGASESLAAVASEAIWREFWMTDAERDEELDHG